MKILSETSHSGEYLFYCLLAVLFALGFLAMSVSFIWEFVSKKSVKGSEVVAFLCISVFTVILSIASYLIITDGARVSYKAIITDFNAVYEQGYVITGQEGEIYSLEKEEQ